MARIGTAALLLGAVACSTGCSGDDGGASNSPLVIAPAEDENGDNQFGNVGEQLGLPLRVIVTTSGGAFAPGTSLTGAAGIATTTWTLGAGLGSQSASARVLGAEGSPVTFSARALAPPPIGGGGGGPQPLRRPLIR